MGLMGMPRNARALLASGLFFLSLGTLVFFAAERVQIMAEIKPFSFLLIFVMVAGTILFGAGILSRFIDRLQ